MAVVPTPILPPHTIIYTIGQWVYDRGSYVFKLGKDIRDVWLLGQWLSTPFIIVGYYVKVIGGSLKQFDDVIREIIAWISGLVNGWTFTGLLYWVSLEFLYIKQNPSQWIKSKLIKIITDGYNLFNLPGVWVRDRLSSLIIDYWRFFYFPANWVKDRLYSIIQDPDFFFNNINSWVVRRLLTFKSDFWGLLLNTSVWLRNYLVSQIVDGWYFFLNPKEWIKHRLSEFIIDAYNFIYFPRNWVKSRLSEFSVEIGSFIDNPTTFIVRKIAATLGVPDWIFNDTSKYLTWYILSWLELRVKDLEEQIKTTFIKIILHFM